MTVSPKSGVTSGTCEVTITVTDADGNVTTKNVTIEVVNSAQPQFSISGGEIDLAGDDPSFTLSLSNAESIDVGSWSDYKVVVNNKEVGFTPGDLIQVSEFEISETRAYEIKIKAKKGGEEKEITQNSNLELTIENSKIPELANVSSQEIDMFIGNRTIVIGSLTNESDYYSGYAAVLLGKNSQDSGAEVKIASNGDIVADFSNVIDFSNLNGEVTLKVSDDSGTDEQTFTLDVTNNSEPKFEIPDQTLPFEPNAEMNKSITFTVTPAGNYTGNYEVAEVAVESDSTKLTPTVEGDGRSFTINVAVPENQILKDQKITVTAHPEDITANGTVESFSMTVNNETPFIIPVETTELFNIDESKTLTVSVAPADYQQFTVTAPSDNDKLTITETTNAGEDLAHTGFQKYIFNVTAQ
jgi:hypothetical protein